jgi:segregation and condensation protein B
MDLDLLKRILEAALLAAPQPLSVAQLTDLFGEGEAPPADEIRRTLHALREDCEGRGVELVEVASGFRYQVRTEIHPHIARLWAERPARYSRALLETLALIAYRQPITRGEIESIRGVAVNTQIIRTLEEREWIRVVGHRDVPGKPALFGTTRAFLDYFNLKSLEQLPPLSALQELPDLEPELDFDGARAAHATLPVAEPALGAPAAAQSGSAESSPPDVEETSSEETVPAPEPSVSSDIEGEGSGHPDTPREDIEHGAEPDAEPARREDLERGESAADSSLDPTGEQHVSPEQTP